MFIEGSMGRFNVQRCGFNAAFDGKDEIVVWADGAGNMFAYVWQEEVWYWYDVSRWRFQATDIKNVYD